MTKRFALVAVAIALGACADDPSAPAPALNAPQMTVTLNADGTGFIGKGDVQSLFGWNNAEMQANFESITFEFDNTATYEWNCEWTTGSDVHQTHHVQEHTETVGVHTTLAVQPRRTGQWTGWYVLGFEDELVLREDFTPQCNGNPAGDGYSGEKVVEGSVTITASGSGLYAVFEGDRRQLLY